MNFFNLENYKLILSRALEVGYEFISFKKVLENKNSNKLFDSDQGLILLRHDIDASLNMALKMALLEKKLNISANYFLMLRSPCYNLLSRYNDFCVEEIAKNGHFLELHYDQGHDEIKGYSILDTQNSIKSQIKVMEEFYYRKINAVSFHQPSKKVLNDTIECNGRINTYDKKLLKNFHYISDSNRKFEPFYKAEFAEKISCQNISNSLASFYPQNIQLLIHPMWWVIEGGSTEDVWSTVLKQNFMDNQEQLISTENAFGIQRKINLN